MNLYNNSIKIISNAVIFSHEGYSVRGQASATLKRDVIIYSFGDVSVNQSFATKVGKCCINSFSATKFFNPIHVIEIIGVAICNLVKQHSVNFLIHFQYSPFKGNLVVDNSNSTCESGNPTSVTHPSCPPSKSVKPLALCEPSSNLSLHGQFGLTRSACEWALGASVPGVSFVCSFSTFLDASVGKAAVIAVASVMTLRRRINKGIQCFLFLTMCDW